MIARLGYFENFDFEDRDYVLETVSQMPGFRGAYHLVDHTSGDAISISLWETNDDADAGQRAVGEATRSGNHQGPGPSRLQRFDVIRWVGDADRQVQSEPTGS